MAWFKCLHCSVVWFIVEKNDLSSECNGAIRIFLIGLQLMNTKGQAEEINSVVALASVPLALRLPGLASTFPYLT